MTSSSAARAKTLGFRSLVVLGGAAVAVSALALPSKAATPPGFTSDQVRLLDTRSSAVTPGPLNGFVPVTVSSDVPSGSSVELTITATNETGSGYIVAYPDGVNPGNALPNTSNVDFTAGTTISTTLVTPVEDDGVVDVYVAGATTQLIVDQQGYFPGSTVSGGTPTRVADSRKAADGFATTGPQSGLVSVSLPAGDYNAGHPVALNVTALPSAKGAGYITAYGTATPPATSTVNYNGQAASNLVFVTPTSDGKVNLKIAGVPANVLVDVEVEATSAASTLVSTADRIADTRTASGLPTGPITGAHTLTINMTDAPAGATGVVLNLTSTGQTGNGFITAYPGTTAPTTSELQFTKGLSVAQTVVVPVTPVTTNGVTTSTITVRVSGGASQVIVDTEGYVSGDATD